ncbi:four helix bundle protein [Patescibacteria group bacterium]|nr:four helix bundle protein [Patescibacteria group bacterium]
MNKGYKKLLVWQEAHKFVLMIYKISNSFPKTEIFALTSQIRRAVVSIVANIVEGQARSKNDFRRFLWMSNGSLVEVEYFLELALDLKYINLRVYNELEKQRVQVAKLLSGLLKSQSLSV